MARFRRISHSPQSRVSVFEQGGKRPEPKRAKMRAQEGILGEMKGEWESEREIEGN